MCWVNIFKSSSLQIKEHNRLTTRKSVPTTTNHSFHSIWRIYIILRPCALHSSYQMRNLNNSRKSDRTQWSIPGPPLKTQHNDFQASYRGHLFGQFIDLRPSNQSRTSQKEKLHPRKCWRLYLAVWMSRRSTTGRRATTGPSRVSRLTPRMGSGRWGKPHPGKPHPRSDGRLYLSRRYMMGKQAGQLWDTPSSFKSEQDKPKRKTSSKNGLEGCFWQYGWDKGETDVYWTIKGHKADTKKGEWPFGETSSRET